MFIFGKRLKELRKQKNLTQQQLGNMVNVTKVSICCYEKGTRTPTLDTLIDLADALQTKMIYLLGTDYYVVSENDENATMNMAKDEIEIIRELRKHVKLYEKLLDDPKRTMEYFERQMR